MNVLHLSSETSWRGGEQQIAYLLEEQLHQGLQVFVLCRPGSATATYCHAHHIPFATVPLRNSLDLASAWQLKALCKREKIALVHVHSSRGHAIMQLAKWLGLLTPYVLTRRVAFTIKNKGINVLRYNSRQLRKIICISRAVLESTAPVVREKDKLQVVYDGIDLDRFRAAPAAVQSLQQELSLPPGTPLIGTVAALTTEKDLPSFIRAAAEIAGTIPDAHFVIAGDGPELAALQALSHSLQMEKQIHFLGRRNDIPQLLPQLKLFLFSSKMEGLGTSVLDAFACQVPVVATAAGGVPEIIHHQKTGLLVPVGNAQELAAGAIRLLKDTALSKEFTENAYQLLTAVFTKEHMAAATL
ncbi:MAG: glycosyltransferase family 4 protein, partial [Bacteroidetes bacterium]|nr:glycosyltransferase family 4 protein [Bacteroidota bacterium]